MPEKPKPKPEYFVDELIFQEPPPKDAVLVLMQKLLEHPGRTILAAWFPGPSTAYGRAASLRKKPPMPGRWEFTGLPNSDEEKGGSNLWIRYIGPDEGGTSDGPTPSGG